MREVYRFFNYFYPVTPYIPIMATPAGRINRLFGTEGGLMLSLYTTFPAGFNPATTPLMVTIDALTVPLWCDRFETHGASGAKATFADFDTERRAQELMGLEFRIGMVEEVEEDGDGEFYLEDLIGFSIEALQPGSEEPLRGVLTDYYDSDANPLFELEIAGRNILVPAVEEFIAHIDFEGRTLKFVLPEGLIDLQQ